MDPQKPRAADVTEVLTEAGTNELEVMLFVLAGHAYAINVAKVREVMMPPGVHRVPTPPPAVEGVFLYRGQAVSIVRLRDFLALPPYAAEALRDPAGTRVIVAEFNQRLTAFRVDSVERICRISSEQVQPLPPAGGLESVAIVAMIRTEEGLVPILDVESIFYQLGGARAMMAEARAEAVPAAVHRADLRIVVAEDSATIRRLLTTRLTGRGFPNLRLFEDGKAAWDWLRETAARGAAAVEGGVDILISDIEMPQMDGLHLCRLIREHPVLHALPVVLFSSLVNDGNEKKGLAVGATAQVSKPDLNQLVDAIEAIVSGHPRAAPVTAGAAPPPVPPPR